MFHNKLTAIEIVAGIILWTGSTFAQSYGGGQPQFLTQALTAVTPNQSTSTSASTANPCVNTATPKTTVSTTGDALIVIVSTAANGTGGTPIAPTVNTMTGWTKAVSVKTSDNLTDTEIWYKLNNTATSTPTGPTITLVAGTPPTSGGGCFVGAWIGDFSNVATASALDQTASNASVVSGSTVSTGTTSATTQANELVIAAGAFQPVAAGNNAATTAKSWVPAAAIQLSDPAPGYNANNWLYQIDNYNPVTATGTQNMTWTLSASVPEYSAAIATFFQAASTQGALVALNNFPNNLAGLSITSNSIDYHCAPTIANGNLCAGTCVYATNPVLLPSAGGTGSGGLDAGVKADMEPPSGYLGFIYTFVAQIDNTQGILPIYVPKGSFTFVHPSCGGFCKFEDTVSPVNQIMTIAAGGMAQMSLTGMGVAIGTPSIPSELGTGELALNTGSSATACVQLTVTAHSLPIRYGLNPLDSLNGSNSIGVAGILE